MYTSRCHSLMGQLKITPAPVSSCADICCSLHPTRLRYTPMGAVAYLCLSCTHSGSHMPQQVPGPNQSDLCQPTCMPRGTATLSVQFNPPPPALKLTSRNQSPAGEYPVPPRSLLPGLDLAYTCGCFNLFWSGHTLVPALASRCCSPAQPAPDPAHTHADYCCSLAWPGPLPGPLSGPLPGPLQQSCSPTTVA